MKIETNKLVVTMAVAQTVTELIITKEHMIYTISLVVNQMSA